MKKLLFVGCLFLGFCLSHSNAQVTGTTEPSAQTTRYSKNYLGINAGFTTGVGFSYRYWPGRDGMQITFLPLYDKNYTYFSLGTGYLHEIKQYTNTRFIFYISNHLTNFLDGPDNSDGGHVIDNLGLGIGLDFDYSDFILNIMLGYAGYDLFDEFMTRPTVEIGIFYNF